jgi:hypothetical protein
MAKGFDPEVEKKARQDDATLDRFLKEEVLPLIYDTRGSKDLEDAEEAQETFVLQHPLVARGKDDPVAADTPRLKQEWDEINARVNSLRAAIEPWRDAWQAGLKTFRQEGKLKGDNK